MTEHKNQGGKQGRVFLKGRSEARFLAIKKPSASSIFARPPVVRDSSSRVSHLYDYVRVGSQFRRVRSDRTVETARVTGFSKDASGIPHIRYDLRFRKPFSTVDDYEGSRSLAIRTFSRMFKHQSDPCDNT